MNYLKQKSVIFEEGHLIKMHVHISLSIPPKFSVSNVLGYLKGENEISITKKFR